MGRRYARRVALLASPAVAGGIAADSSLWREAVAVLRAADVRVAYVFGDSAGGPAPWDGDLGLAAIFDDLDYESRWVVWRLLSLEDENGAMASAVKGGGGEATGKEYGRRISRAADACARGALRR